MVNGWQISGGTENNSYVGIFGNSGEITISKNGLCGSVPQVNYNCDGTESGCCSGDSTYEYHFELRDFSGNVVGSPFVQINSAITSCNREMFVAWYRDDEHNSIGTIRVLDDIRPVDSKRSRTFMMKNVDECEQIITSGFYEIPYFISDSGATRPIIPFAQSQEFSTSGYVDSGYPPIAKYPCDDSNHEIKYSGGTTYNGHKIKYMPINKNIPCDDYKSYDYGNGKCIVNNPYLVELYFPHNYTGIDTARTTVNIGIGAFSGNTNLTAVTFSKVQDIYNYAFSGCTNLTNIDWGHKPCGISGDNRVTRSIGRAAFMDCNVPCLDLPNSITSIGISAFSNCNVSYLHLPRNDSYSVISISTFENCTSLSSVTIPDNISRIDNHAFDGCSSLPISGGVTYAGNTSEGGRGYLCAVSSDKTSSAYTLNEHTRFIHSEAFSENPNLTKIDLSNTWVIQIGSSAFTNCTSLSSVTFTRFPSNIGSEAFRGCTSLSSVTIPDNITSIEDEAFSGCTSLTSCTIGTGVTSIGSYAFSNCSGMTSIDIPNSVTSIGSGAFYNCSNLTSCTIGSGVTRISAYTFYHCTSLTNISIPNNVTDIRESAFKYCSGLTNISIPNSVVYIANEALCGCASLTSCTIGNRVTFINQNAFSECNALSSITFTKTTPPSLYSGNVFPTGEGKAFNRIIVPNSSAVTDYTQAWSGRTDMQGVTISTS